MMHLLLPQASSGNAIEMFNSTQIKSLPSLLSMGLKFEACCSPISDVTACVLPLTADGKHMQ